MPRAEATYEINRRAEDVFAYVAEVENNPRWRSYVVASRWIDDGPMRVGRRGEQTSRVLGRSYTVIAEIVAWDPPRHVAWQTLAGGASVRTDCRVEAVGDASRLTIGVEGEFTNFVLRILSPLALAMMKRQARGDTRRLTKALEAHTEDRLAARRG